MPTYRFNVNLPYFSNLPSDVAINAFHATRVTDLSPTEVEDVAEAFVGFYNTDHTGTSTGPVARYLSPCINRNACFVEVYDLDDAEPRPPIHTEPFVLAPMGGGSTGLPLETAACLSFHGTFPAGVNRARRRGRAFMGPLASNALSAGTASAFPSLSSNFNGALSAAAEWLLAEIPTQTGLGFWSIWSRVSNAPVEIVGGWVDNALDTQRRRGNDPTTRSIWP